MSDRELANYCYNHAGIPPRDWAKHYEMDSHHGTLRVRARRHYLAIYRSISASV